LTFLHYGTVVDTGLFQFAVKSWQFAARVVLQ